MAHIDRDDAYFKPDDIIRMAKKELAGEKTCLPDIYRHVNIRRIIRTIQEARSNPVFIPFDGKALVEMTSRADREALLKTVHLGEFEHPCVVLSQDRVPLIYYLPGIYSEVVEHEILSGAVALQTAFKDLGWRANAELLVDRESNRYPAGSATFSYSWYGQGAKRTLPPERSANLGRNEDDCLEWIHQTQHIRLAVDITLALIHPQSYYQAAKTRRIIERSGTEESRVWAKNWGCVFTGIAAISNRWCNDHYDTRGDPHHYDALVNAGDAKVKLNMHHIDASFQYLPGTGIFFPGKPKNRVHRRSLKSPSTPKKKRPVPTDATPRIPHRFIVPEEPPPNPPSFEGIYNTNTSADYLREWCNRSQEDLTIIVDLEAPSSTTCVLCNEAPQSLYRCQDCFGDRMVCQACCVNVHKYQPFHRIERWSDKGFSMSSLIELGLVISLGHGGSECPVRKTIPDVFSARYQRKQLTIVHTNGVHQCEVEWCMCQSEISHYEQLLKSRLFPATVLLPSTAFTLEALSMLHLIRVECKVASSSYYSLLQRLHGGHTESSPDRSREMERASRCYQSIMARVNEGHFIWIPLSVGCLALFCPACPQPGINVTDRTWSSTDPEWMLTPMLCADGNFKFDHLRMKCPKNEVLLRDGLAYLVTNSTYEAHLKSATGKQPKSTCVNHKAVNLAERGSKAHLDNTGIGALSCRHGLFIPHTVVNFKKGEQQKNMDFAMSEAFKYFTRMSTPQGVRIPRILVSYDIMCQYEVGMLDRMRNGTFLTVPKVPIIGLNFIEGSAHSDGEGMESLWSQLNKQAGSTRAMSLAHRQEVIDDAINDSNLKKIINLPKALVKKWFRAVKMVGIMQDGYEELQARIPDEDLRAWDRAYDIAMKERGPKLRIFDTEKKSCPSLREVQLQLAEEELESSNAPGAVGFLTEGLLIVQAQLNLRAFIATKGKNLSVAQQLDIVERRRRLKNRLVKFNRRAKTLLSSNDKEVDGEDEDEDEDEDEIDPQLAENEDEDTVEGGADGDEWTDAIEEEEEGEPNTELVGSEDDNALPENATVPLPSSLNAAKRASVGWEGLGIQEEKLRVAQMEDALKGLRIALGEKLMRFQKVLRPNKSQKKVTRAWSGIYAYDARANLQADIYEAARNALSSLNAEAALSWRAIDRQTDLAVSGDIQHPNRVGQSSHVIPWIWRKDENDISDETEQSSVLSEVYRVNYVRARARYERWSEEKLLVMKEMTWTLEWFNFQASRWATICRRHSSSPGIRAFAQKKIYTWRKLEENALSLFTKYQYLRERLPSGEMGSPRLTRVQDDGHT
ncbi:hypothetical protein ONZ45_g10166 [Pleurotus djamor]|nr:hypothetical protein ONZ45_g10166 [Pleurotus djamor]